MLFSGAGFYEQKCCRLDALTFPESPLVAVEGDSFVFDRETLDPRAFERRLRERGVDSLAIYAACGFDESSLREIRLPSVSRCEPSSSLLRTRRHPSVIRSPLTRPALGEAVEPQYFDWLIAPAPPGGKVVVGSLHQGPESLRMTELTFNRLSRFRDDVDWNVFDAPPSVDEVRELSLWVDVAAGDGDFDGWTAEALVAGFPVVAAKTPINALRLANGERGLLVRPNDPNELAHAIASMLFKEEVREPRTAIARATRDDFLPGHRAREWNLVFAEATR